VIAEVREIKFPSGASLEPPEGASSLAEEAAHAPGSEQLLTLMDASTGEGYVIHVWNDRAAYDAFAARRQQMVAEAEGSGSQVDAGRLYEVTYRS
jgi:heme-degrading monooxygenase HmoA